MFGKSFDRRPRKIRFPMTLVSGRTTCSAVRRIPSGRRSSSEQRRSSNSPRRRSVVVAMKSSCPPPTAMWYAADHGVIRNGAPHTEGGQLNGQVCSFVIQTADGTVVGQGEIPTTAAGFQQVVRDHGVPRGTPLALENALRGHGARRAALRARPARPRAATADLRAGRAGGDGRCGRSWALEPRPRNR